MTRFPFLATSSLVALITLGLFANPARAQINVEDVIISEFFDDILRVNPGSVDNLFEIIQPDNISCLAVADPFTCYVCNFTEIWEIDLLNNSVTFVVDVGGTSPTDLKIGLNGEILYVSASDGVGMVDPITGAKTIVFDDSFFGANDITVSAEGNLYIPEFFDGLGFVSPDLTWTRIGDWPTNFFSHVDIGPDGFLYLITTFEDGDVYRVNPVTGAGTMIGEDLGSGFDDIAVAADGMVWIAGLSDTDDDGLNEDVVFMLDPDTGDVSVVVDENMVGSPNPPFFNPMDLEIYHGGFFQHAPGEFAPLNFLVDQGSFLSGTLADMLTSDNADLTIARASNDVQARTRVVLNSVSPVADPTVLAMTIESAVFARSGVEQTVELFNFQSSTWESIDSRAASRFVDRIITVEPTGDLSRFVQPGTLQIQARIQFRSPAQRQQFSSSLDHFFWSIR